MMFNPYLAERLTEERVKDTLREAEQARLIRAAKGPRKLRGWRLRLASVFKNLSAVFTGHRVDEPRHRSLSTMASPGWKSRSGS